MKIKKEYLKSLIKQKSLKQREVAKQIGVSPQDFNNWMFRGVFPHYDKLKEVAQILGVTTSDLTTEKLFLETDGSMNYKNYVDYSGKDAIPFFDFDAGSIRTFLKEESTEIDPTDYVHIPGLSADVVLPYFGKDMEPAISGGDLIALRKIEDNSFFNYGNIYLITTQEHVILRTVNKSDKKGYLTLCANSGTSDNIEIPFKKIIATHLLVSVIKRQVI